MPVDDPSLEAEDPRVRLSRVRDSRAEQDLEQNSRRTKTVEVLLDKKSRSSLIRSQGGENVKKGKGNGIVVHLSPVTDSA